MHEYSLFGQVAESRQTQLLQILAGISAMRPRDVYERHLVFKPANPPTRAVAQVGGSQAIQDAAKLAARQAQAANQDVYYVRLVEDLMAESGARTSNEQEVDGHEDGEDDDVEMSNTSVEKYATNGATAEEAETTKARWKLLFYDVPEAGKRPVISRFMNITHIEDGDAISFIEGLGYTFVTQFMQAGHRFTHNNTALLMTRMLLMPDAVAARPKLEASSLPPASEFKPLDASGAYTLHAAVRVLDASKPEVVTRATNELLQFKETMKGVVDMRVVDRLALDTRLK